MSALIMTLDMTMAMNDFGFCGLDFTGQQNSSLVLAKLKKNKLKM